MTRAILESLEARWVCSAPISLDGTTVSFRVAEAGGAFAHVHRFAALLNNAYATWSMAPEAQPYTYLPSTKSPPDAGLFLDIDNNYLLEVSVRLHFTTAGRGSFVAIEKRNTM